MNRKTTLTITIDPSLKTDVQAILKPNGLSLSQAINLFLQQIQQTKTIPWVMKNAPHPVPTESIAEKSCLELMQNDLGCLQGAPQDLSTNKSYLNDYGL